jgi:hypothetical protein
MLVRGYRQASQNWRTVSRIVPVNDFRQSKAIRPYTADSLLAEVGADGELKHTSLGESSYPVQASTYGRIVGITRQTMVNDGGLGEVFEVQQAIGLAAGRTLNKTVWLAIRDSSSFFTTDNGNNVTGGDSALSVAGITAAMTALREMVDDGGEPIGLEPGALCVAPANEATARQLLNSAEVTIDSETADNPWKGFAELAVVPHLGTSAGGTDATWYLASRPSDSPAVLVALLNGQDRPIVEQVQTPPEYLGVQMRCYLDFGVALGDPKAIIRAVGS